MATYNELCHHMAHSVWDRDHNQNQSRIHLPTLFWSFKCVHVYHGNSVINMNSWSNLNCVQTHLEQTHIVRVRSQELFILWRQVLFPLAHILVRTDFEKCMLGFFNRFRSTVHKWGWEIWVLFPATRIRNMFTYFKTRQDWKPECLGRPGLLSLSEFNSTVTHKLASHKSLSVANWRGMKSA